MAKVIEKRIIDTINNWKDGVYNLSVRDKVKIDGDKATYYLWGSPIVTVTGKTVSFCFCGYASQTTKERISELLWEFADCFIFRKNWLHYLKMGDNYYKIDETQCYTVKDGILFDSDGNKVKLLEGFKY